METTDCVVIGAGVVGLATARALAMAGREVTVVDQAPVIGAGTSSRSSEVIHAGIYYPTGSLKARLCVAGRERLYTYAATRNIAHRRIGKLIVATSSSEIRILEKYKFQASINGVDDLAWLTTAQVVGLEPEVKCVAALLSPSTGIIDSHELMLTLQSDIESAGGTIVLNARVTAALRAADDFDLIVEGRPAIRCRQLVNSAGLGAPALARAIEGLPAARIPAAYFAKGHYFILQGRSPFHRLVYPVAEKAGIGIHVTLDLSGAARFGPDITWIEEVDYDFHESRREVFAEAIRRYYPALDSSRLQPAYTGIRPKIVGPDELSPADFLIDGPAGHGVPGLVNLYGIESPGLTASLALADEVAALLN
jgi:L-2-hydroxyglutarate oxidase LhgO